MTSSLESGDQTSFMGLLGSSNKATISSEKITSEEALAILSSRKFLEKFIRDNDILKVLYSTNWDEEKKNWKISEDAPELKDGYQLLLNSLEISFDKSLITLDFTFHDADEVSNILNLLIYSLNEHLRNLSIQESTLNIAFLKEEIVKTQLADSKEMLYRLVENQTQSIMLANTRKDYAFKIIDPAVQPEFPAGPNRKLIVIIGTILGSIFSLAFALVLNFVKQFRLN
mgnify:CR=1 FL=1